MYLYCGNLFTKLKTKFMRSRWIICGVLSHPGDSAGKYTKWPTGLWDIINYYFAGSADLWSRRSQNCAPKKLQLYFRNTQPTKRKCFYYNSGYCKFSRKENGRKKFCSKENCKVFNCPDKVCPDTHPKKCKFNVTCQCQSRCFYLHENTYLESVRMNLIIQKKK